MLHLNIGGFREAAAKAAHGIADTNSVYRRGENHPERFSPFFKRQDPSDRERITWCLETLRTDRE